MILRIQIWIFCLLILAGLSKCVSSFDFEPGEAEEILVINGRITQSSYPDDIFVSYTTEYGNPNTSPVGNANVLIYDDLGNVEQAREIELGKYRHFKQVVQGCPGTSYHIEVSLPGDRTYRSVPEKMPDPVHPVNLYAEPAIVDLINENGTRVSTKMVRVFIDTPVKIKGSPVWLRWSTQTIHSFTERTCSILTYPETCYITNINNPTDIILFKSESIESNDLRNFQVATKRFSSDFVQKHYFNVAQLSITNSSYEYWKDVKTISNPSGTIFETPPAPVRGNVYNVNNDAELVLGFYEAASVDTIRTYTLPHDFPWYSYNEYCNVYYNSDKCCNCLLFENSSLNPPPYW